MTCQIVLQNFQSTYYPGNKISGHVVCTFPSSESIGGVRVKLRGIEHTDWVEGELYYDSIYSKTRYRKVHYSGNEEFLAVDLTLIEERTMASGRYEYPFTFTLPRNLPVNFQGSYGYVKYFIKGTVDIPLKFDYEDEIYFKVQSPIDFNEIRSELQMKPTTYQNEETLCCLCCISGPITLDVHLQKEAFVLGETAKIKIDVTNLSYENVDKINLKIIMVIESKATSPKASCKNENELVASKFDTGVGAREQRTYDLDLNIPSSTALYNFTRSTLFKQYFILKIVAALPVLHSDMEINTIVVLGHIPLAGVPQSQQSQQISHPTSMIPGGPFSPPPPVCVTDNEPPPYAASDKGPPYPTGPPAFPAPPSTPRKIGFSFPPGSGAESTPSAPTRAEMAEGGNFIMNGVEGFACNPSNASTEQPPPTYGAAIGAPFAITPGGADVYPPDVYPPNHGTKFVLLSSPQLIRKEGSDCDNSS